jgi:hypothetical protein
MLVLSLLFPSYTPCFFFPVMAFASDQNTMESIPSFIYFYLEHRYVKIYILRYLSGKGDQTQIQ